MVFAVCKYLLLAECEVRTASCRQFFPSFLGPSAKRAGHENKEENEDLKLAVRTEQTRLMICLLYGFLDYSEKGTKLFDSLISDQELGVRTATYGPEFDQTQHAKSQETQARSE